MKLPLLGKNYVAYSQPEGIIDTSRKIKILQVVRVRKSYTMAASSRGCPLDPGSDCDEIRNQRRRIINHRAEDFLFNSYHEEVDISLFSGVRVRPSKQFKNVLDETRHRFLGLLDSCS